MLSTKNNTNYGTIECGEMPVQILEEEIVYKGEFINTIKTTISIPPKNKADPNHVEIWETVQKKKSGKVSGIYVIPILKYSDGRQFIVAIKQFRICMKGFCLEFPGGHLDANETPQEAAIRELKEETGYTGPNNCSNFVTISAGISVEACSVLVNTLNTVVLVIDGDAPENDDVKPESPEGEMELIEVVLLPMEDLLHTLKHYAEEENLYVSGELYMFAYGRIMKELI